MTENGRWCSIAWRAEHNARIADTKPTSRLDRGPVRLKPGYECDLEGVQIAQGTNLQQWEPTVSGGGEVVENDKLPSQLVRRTWARMSEMAAP